MTRLRTRVASYGPGLCLALFSFLWTHPHFLRPRCSKPRFLEGSLLPEACEGMMVLLFLVGSVSLDYDPVSYDGKK